MKPFSGDSLYELLVGEIAGYRTDYETALRHYLLATAETQDPGVAERATRLALYMKNDKAALAAANVHKGNMVCNLKGTDVVCRLICSGTTTPRRSMVDGR